MKKIGIIAGIFLVGIVFFGRYSVLAVYPPCNAAEVDMSSPLPNGVVCNSSLLGDNYGQLPKCDASQNPCGRDDYVACYNPAPPFGFKASTCWKKGQTVLAPSCSDGGQYIERPGGHPSEFCCAKRLCGSFRPDNGYGCANFCTDTQPTCDDPLYNKLVNGTGCINPDGANSKWERTAKCTDGTEGVQAAIGCVPTGSLPDFVAFILKFALGAAGGIIVLMVIVTGYGLLTSQGNPEKLAAAKENIVSIFSGLILIVFSLVLLQTIGAGILGLPGF